MDADTRCRSDESARTGSARQLALGNVFGTDGTEHAVPFGGEANAGARAHSSDGYGRVRWPDGIRPPHPVESDESVARRHR